MTICWKQDITTEHRTKKETTDEKEQKKVKHEKSHCSKRQ